MLFYSVKFMPVISHLILMSATSGEVLCSELLVIISETKNHNMRVFLKSSGFDSMVSFFNIILWRLSDRWSC